MFVGRRCLFLLFVGLLSLFVSLFLVCVLLLMVFVVRCGLRVRCSLLFVDVARCVLLLCVVVV